MEATITVNPQLKGIFRDDFASSSWSLKDGQNSPDGKWYCRYAGFGETRIVTYKGTKAMKLRPALPATPDGTRACSTVARQKFKDFDMTVYMSTEKQTRVNGNNWETAWIFFRLTDQSHHYYVYLQKDGGLELGKKDMDVWEERQVFLKVTDLPPFQFSKWYKVRILCVGYHIKVWVDDVKYIDIEDNGKIGNFGNVAPHPPSAQMLEGFIGPYCEDAEVYFDRWEIEPL